MMDRANEFGNIHSGLSSLKADGWEGRAADHFRSKFDVQIKGWVDAQEAFSAASEAYNSYATALASAQSQCDGIRSRWKAGRDAVQQAQNNQADARSQAAADGGTPAFDASCDEGPGRSAMAAAVADFQTLVDQVNEAGDLLITALNAGISKLPERTWWDAVTRTVGSILGGAFEAVVELVKLVWKLSGGEGMWDFGRMLMGQMTWDEYDIKHQEIPIETIMGMAKALWKDPVCFMTAVGKSLIDWDTWTDDPGRAIGHLLPDVILAVATMGGSAGVSAGEKALTGTARALRIGKEVFKAILPISPDDVSSLRNLGRNLVGKLSANDAARAAERAANAVDQATDASRAARAGGAIGDTSGAAHAASGAADAAGNANHAASGGGGIASSASSAGHTAPGAGSTSHGVNDAADTAGNASHASRGGAGVKDSALPPTDPGHRSNGVSSAAQPAVTPHASGAGDAGTGEHTTPANTAPSASHGAHNNAFMNADTGGATHGAGSTTNGATNTPTTGAPATVSHGAPATGAPTTGTHGAGTTGTHGAGSTTNSATSTPDAPTTPKKQPTFEELLGGGDKQPYSGKAAADMPTTHADETADASKAGHGSGDASGSGKADADAQHGHDSAEHADADPKAKDHSADGKADDAADSARNGDKTEADKPTSDKSHKEDDAAHHDGDTEHPKDADDADTKSTKDESDTHKSDDDNSGAESDNSTVTDKNGEESQEIKSEEGTDETKRNPHSGDPDHNWGTYVDEDGIPHIDPSDPRPYLNPKNRPSFRKGIVDKVREAFTDADGVLRDWRGKPVDWQPGQPRAGIWDMGHKPGHKYSDVWRSYVNGEMTPQQFLDWYNDPKNYRVEFSSRNRAHIDE